MSGRPLLSKRAIEQYLLSRDDRPCSAAFDADITSGCDNVVTLTARESANGLVRVERAETDSP